MATYARIRVDGTSVDVKVFLGQDLGAFVNGATGSIKDTTKHVLRDTKFQAFTSEFHSCLHA